ncbi:MAG: hypothetical protein WC720_05135 [Candidatus Shapirobacteria bacterium]|jgi:hypothetical protein
MADIQGKFNFDNEQNNDERKPQIQVNSLDYLVSVDRLPIFRSQAQGIYLYGIDNNYPRKIMQSADRCSSLVTVRNKQAQFIQGLGFPGATALDVKKGTAIVINTKGQTAYDLLRFCSIQKSNINIAIHVNYNALGEAVEFTPVQYDFVRRKVNLLNEDFDRHIITNIWHLENDYTGYGFAAKIQEFNKWMNKKKHKLSFIALECFDYNPDPLVVREQIELSGGIENYSGQLFYMKRTEDVYQKALYDSVADKYQFLSECDLASLSNIQNGYSASGILKYFGTLSGTREVADAIKKINQTKGANNTGRIITMPFTPGADNNIPTNIFEPTEMQNIDKLYTDQVNRAEIGIQSLFSCPNALIGKDTEGNFATQKMQETFEYYNSITEPLRQELEIELTRLFSNSVFASQLKLPIEIEPLQFISKIKTIESTNTQSNEDTSIDK